MINFPDVPRKHGFCVFDFFNFNVALTKIAQNFRENIGPNELRVITLSLILDFLERVEEFNLRAFLIG
jgi:hypothetical protein